jgi:hypothetical protein
MDDDPLENVYSYVERAYVRLQAGDLLIRCMEESSAFPIQNLVEGLVMAGPQSINALREILAEAERRKAQIQDDLHQLVRDLDRNLNSYGLHLSGELRDMALTSLSSIGILALMREQHINDSDTQTSCLQLIRDSRDLIESLVSRLILLDEIKYYLEDWLWGVAFQSARQIANSNSKNILVS